VASSETIVRENKPVVKLPILDTTPNESIKKPLTTQNAVPALNSTQLQNSPFSATGGRSAILTSGEKFRKTLQSRNSERNMGSQLESDYESSDDSGDLFSDRNINYNTRRNKNPVDVDDNIIESDRYERDEDNEGEMTIGGKHEKITIGGIDSLKRHTQEITASEMSMARKVDCQNDQEEILGRCNTCCALISRGPPGPKGETGAHGPRGNPGNSIHAITINWTGVEVDCLTSQSCSVPNQFVLESRGCEHGACKLWQCQNGTLQWLSTALDASNIPPSIADAESVRCFRENIFCKSCVTCKSTVAAASFATRTHGTSPHGNPHSNSYNHANHNSHGKNCLTNCSNDEHLSKDEFCGTTNCGNSCCITTVASCPVKCFSSCCDQLFAEVQKGCGYPGSSNPSNPSVSSVSSGSINYNNCGCTGPTGLTGPNIVCGQPEYVPLWFYDETSCKLIRIVDKTCKQFVGKPGDKVVDTSSGRVFEANCFGRWRPLPGSLRGPTGPAGSAIVLVNTQNFGAIRGVGLPGLRSSDATQGCHGKSGNSLKDLPDPNRLPENSLFYEKEGGRILMLAGVSYGYLSPTWVLAKDLEMDLGVSVVRGLDNAFYDSEVPMIWLNGKAITNNLQSGDCVIDTFNGNQFMVTEQGLELVGCMKGPQGDKGVEGPRGNGFLDQALLQPAVTGDLIPVGAALKLGLSNATPVFFGNQGKFFDLDTNRIELPNYLDTYTLIKLSLYLSVAHDPDVRQGDSIVVVVKKVGTLADWTYQSFPVSTGFSDRFIQMNEVFTGLPGDKFEIHLRNLTSKPISIRSSQMAAGNRLLIDFTSPVSADSI
jgi:hypothetical protein